MWAEIFLLRLKDSCTLARLKVSMNSNHLAPCSACARHVRAQEKSCPFCGAAVQATAAPVLPTTRLSRAGIVAFGLAVAATQVGCANNNNNSGTVTQGGNLSSGGEGASTGTGVDADAGAVVTTDDPNNSDAAADADATADSGTNVTPVAPMYGAPVARYGAPAPQAWEG